MYSEWNYGLLYKIQGNENSQTYFIGVIIVTRQQLSLNNQTSALIKEDEGFLYNQNSKLLILNLMCSITPIQFYFTALFINIIWSTCFSYSQNTLSSLPRVQRKYTSSLCLTLYYLLFILPFQKYILLSQYSIPYC